MSPKVHERNLRGRVAAVIAGTVIVVAGTTTAWRQSQDTPPPAAGDANVWVDTNGGTCTRQSTAGSYSDAAACATLDAAEAVSQSGDTVRVKAGSYGAQTISGTANSTDKADVTFLPADGESVTFTGKVDFNTVDDLIFEGFTITADQAIDLEDTQRVTIRQNILARSASGTSSASGIEFCAGSGTGNNIDLLIEDNDIDRNGGGDGFDCRGGAGTRITIRGNLVEDFGEDGYHMEMTGTSSGGVVTFPIVMEDNVARDANPQPSAHSDCMQVLGGTDVVVDGFICHDYQHGILYTNNSGATGDFDNVVLLNGGSSTTTMTNLGNAPGSGTEGSFTNSTFFNDGYAIGQTDGGNTDWAWRNIVMMDTDGGTPSNLENSLTFGSESGTNIGSQAVADTFVSTSTGSSDALYPARVAARHADRDLGVDLRLKSTSPGVGLADAGLAPSGDVRSENRDGDPDAGAYERVAGDP